MPDPAVIKAVATLLSDGRTRKGIGWIIAAILSPLIVLLALLSLGVRDIHTGPTLPAFFTPDILKVLQDKFNIGTITTVDEDMATMIG